ncbi:MAG TPA: YaeQ family protein, partial [Rubrobacter sp.]|nr:YaeQ family protein [Rubrobacter sp.]
STPQSAQDATAVEWRLGQQTGSGARGPGRRRPLVARILRPAMALTATVYNFSIQLADVDRAVYETLELRVARQPSETAEYMLMRVLGQEPGAGAGAADSGVRVGVR